MIEIKKATEKEILRLEHFCKSENILSTHNWEDSFLYLIIQEGNQILGLTAVQLSSPQIGYISCLYIQPSARRQGLGDGLLRATLSHLDQIGVKQVLIEGSTGSEGFLQQEGLVPAKGFDQNYLYQCDPGALLNQGCRSRQED